ncbi:hypothetical protein AVEN_156653-1 [Araneus ventricosus]|uniref:Tc1-like transposase DDE domain-containing protein n=1 Tax=Araneus ventricosus TaxID=182803 RepID=A0A4Y2KKQ9_ARAVE|nr:hypothetical protein AVEN_156653-1 [Araneus ventricosus]
MLNDGVILLSCTARQYPYCSQNSRIAAKIQVVSLNPPPYSPDLAPNLGTKHLSVTRFSSNSDAEKAVENWLNGKGRDFYQAGFKKLVLI